jgi:hypothetical protein
MSLRVRLSVTSLEERDTPSVPGPVDPSGAPVDVPPNAPPQLPPGPVYPIPVPPPMDPHTGY